MSWLGSAFAYLCARTDAQRMLGVVAVIAFGCANSGCSTGGQSMAAFAQQTSAGGPTLAFESIDGPPPAVFDRLVSALNSEAQGKPVLIVQRDGSAAYHVRTYLAAEVKRGRSVIAWVFDVYDRDEQRALRLTGQEPAGKAGRDAWAAADDQLLRRIAQAGLNGMATYLGGSESQPAPQSPERGQAIASADDSAVGTPPAGSRSALGFSAR
jgi:hypothetical protein